MLTPTNDVRLIDFGIAKLFTPGQQGTMIGTPGYAAPEQYQGLAEPRTDVYGLGATLHHLLTGRDPQRHPPFAFPSARQLNPAITAQTDAAVERAVKMDLHARFGSAQEMRRALTAGQMPPRLPLPALVAGIVILVLVAFGLGAVSVPWLCTPTPTPPIVGGRATLAPTLTVAPPTRAPTAAPTLPPPTRATVATLPPTAVPPTTVPPRVTDTTEMVSIPAGEFLMGSSARDSQADSDEKPQHTVYLDAFWIDKYEVTNAQYKKCVDAGKCSRPSDTSSSTRTSYYGNVSFDDYPVIYVSWNDAKAYCEWAGKRLPTEAEWEKAARGTDERVYPWGSTLDGTRLNFCDKNCPYNWKDSTADDGYADTAPVGSYPRGASSCGALDMAGNVWEWVADWYGANYYSSSPRNNPKGPSSGQYKVLRGGAWNYYRSSARAANRDYDYPDYRNYNVGYRCAQ
jgi:formylglycine-generating enzyme required for sulfatase activity